MIRINDLKSNKKYITLWYFVCMLFFSCSSSSDEVMVPGLHKGAKTPLMQSVADYMDKIQVVEGFVLSAYGGINNYRGEFQVLDPAYPDVCCRDRFR